MICTGFLIDRPTTMSAKLRLVLEGLMLGVGYGVLALLAYGCLLTL